MATKTATKNGVETMSGTDARHAAKNKAAGERKAVFIYSLSLLPPLAHLFLRNGNSPLLKH
jgi:hypothetical protein